MSHDEQPEPHTDPDAPGRRVTRALLLDTAQRARHTAAIARSDGPFGSSQDELRRRAEQRGVVPTPETDL
jgi:hypothetical protein